MESLSWRQNSKLLQSPLLDLRVARAFLLTKGRNAWHSTWIRRYQGSHAVHGMLEWAKEDAEAKRGPGNVFYIREMPVLVLDIEDEHELDCSIVLTDFYADNPFARWSKHEAGSVLELETPVGAVLNAFSAEGAWLYPAPNPHSLIVARARSFELPHSGTVEELHSWTSRPVGAQRSLAWVKETNNYVFDGVNAVERQFRLVNSDERLEQWRTRREEDRRRRMDQMMEELASWESAGEDPST